MAAEGGGRFWVFDWLDSLELRTEDQIISALASKGERRTLAEAARKIGPRMPEPVRRDDIALLAGSGIDLTGRSACNSHRCMIGQVDRLFRHAWHYFDRLIVDDQTPLLARVDGNDAVTPALAAGWITALQYARSIGAEPLLDFAYKPKDSKWAFEYLEQRGFTDIRKLVDDLARGHADIGRHAIRQSKTDKLSYEVQLDMGPMGYNCLSSFAKSKLRGKSDRAIRYLIAREFVSGIVADLASDLFIAERLNVPLGSASPLQEEILARLPAATGNNKSEDLLALHLDLPIFDNANLAQLMEFRMSNVNLFHQFQRSLRAAFSEYLRASDGTDPAALVQRVKHEIIDKELAQLNVTMKRNRRSLGVAVTQVAIGLTGAAASTYGLAAGTPALAAATIVGSAIVAAGAGLIANSVTRRETVDESDMYFLFRAGQHTHVL